MSNYPDSLQINPASSPNLRTSVRFEAQSALKTAREVKCRGACKKKTGKKKKKMECGEWRKEGWGVGNWKREVVIIFARLGTSERQTSTAVEKKKGKKKKRMKQTVGKREWGNDENSQEGQLNTKEEEGWADLESEERRGWKKMKWEEDSEAWRENPIHHMDADWYLHTDTCAQAHNTHRYKNSAVAFFTPLRSYKLQVGMFSHQPCLKVHIYHWFLNNCPDLTVYGEDRKALDIDLECQHMGVSCCGSEMVTWWIMNPLLLLVEVEFLPHNTRSASRKGRSINIIMTSAL